MLEREGVLGVVPSVRPGGRFAQTGALGLLGVSLAVIVLARTLSPGGSSGPTLPAVASSATPHPLTPAASNGAASSADPVAPSPNASPSPARTPPATASRTYRVRSGDTLVAIASRFGTTVGAIARTNHLAQTRMLRIGQLLMIP